MQEIDMNEFKKLGRYEKIDLLGCKLEEILGDDNDDVYRYFHEHVFVQREDGVDLFLIEMSDDELMTYASKLNEHLEKIESIKAAHK